MATDPLEVFEEQLREEFDGAELWNEQDRESAVPADEVAIYALDDMLMFDDDVAEYFAAIPSWFEFESIFSGTVSVREVAAWAVSEYCRSESQYLAELIENGF